MDSHGYFKSSVIPCSKFIFFSRVSAWKLTVSYNFRNYLSYPWAFIGELRIFSVGYLGEQTAEHLQCEGDSGRQAPASIHFWPGYCDNCRLMSHSGQRVKCSTTADLADLADLLLRLVCHRLLPGCQRRALTALCLKHMLSIQRLLRGRTGPEFEDWKLMLSPLKHLQRRTKFCFLLASATWCSTFGNYTKPLSKQVHVFLSSKTHIGVIVVVVAKSLGCVWFFVTPWSVAWHVPLSVGILQARILEWVAIFLSRGSSDPGIEPASHALAGKWLTRGAPRRSWDTGNISFSSMAITLVLK